MDDVQLRLTETAEDLGSTPALHAYASELDQDDQPTSLRFPKGGVYVLDRSPEDTAAEAIERIDIALHRLSMLADEQDAADAQLHRLIFGDDDGPPRAA
jgi:hypothetical protein